MSDLEKFLNKEGQIIIWPKKVTQEKIVVEYLATKFEENKKYTTKEVNELISRWHTFNDFCLLRRELIEQNLVQRTPNGSEYWKNMGSQ